MEDNRPLFKSTPALLEAAARELERAAPQLMVASALLGTAWQDEWPFREDGYGDAEPADEWKREGAHTLAELTQQISGILAVAEELRDAETFFRTANKGAVRRRRIEENIEIKLPF